MEKRTRLEFLPVLVSAMITALSIANARGERIEAFEVRGEASTSCRAYLHFPDAVSPGPLPLLLDQDGTGRYTTSVPFGAHSPEDPGAPGYLLRAGKAAVLTIDKPGVVPAERSPEGFRIVHAIYDRHTQRDLVACVLSALHAISARADVKPSGWILSGHSEGAQIVVRAYQKLVEKTPEFAKRVELVSLSGLPMLPWREMIARQLEGRPKERAEFWQAYARGDDEALFRLGPVGSAYWRDAFRTPSLERNLRSLAKRGAKAAFAIFQGLQDRKVSVAPVTEFERWNRAVATKGKPALQLRAHYYPTGHGLNLSAENDRYLAFAATFEGAPSKDPSSD